MPEFNRAEVHHFVMDSDHPENAYAYWTLGNPTHPPLLVIPGLTGTHTDLLDLSRGLRDSFYLIVPDMPGWGSSPRLPKKVTLRNYAEYLIALMDHLNIKETDILGHCMGACMGIDFALLAPQKVKRLVLVSTPYTKKSFILHLLIRITNWEEKVPALYPVFYFWRSRFFRFFSDFFVLKFKHYSKTERLAFDRLENYSKIDVDHRTVKENWKSLIHFNYKKVKELKKPIYLIYGSKDLIVSKKHALAFKELLPDAKFDFIENAGHIPPLETPQTLATLVANYLV